MNKNINENEEKQRKNKLIALSLIIALLLVLILIIILIFNIPKPNPVSPINPEPEQGLTVEQQYDKLLSILNKQVSDSSILEDEKANKVISIKYEDKHFYISGINESFVYDCEIEVNKTSIVDEKSAYDYLMETGVSKFNTGVIDRYDIYESLEFKTKYVNDEHTNYAVGKAGSVINTYMTKLNNDESITKIYGVKLANVMSDGYTPINITIDNTLYQIYKHIAG